MIICFLIGIVSSCGKRTPQETLQQWYETIQQGDYDKLTSAIYLDSLPPLTESEIKEYSETLKGLIGDKYKVQSFEIVSYPEETNDSGKYVVNMKYVDGISESQTGWMKKNSEGEWGIYLLTDSIKLSDEAPQMLDAMKFALVKVLSNRGIPEYQFKLGLLFINESPYVTQDTIQGVRLIKSAVDKGYSLAQGAYGYCLFHGIGVKEDKPTAMVYLKKGADNNDPTASSLLGWCYVTGCEVEQDYEKAYELFKKGAERDDVLAIRSLGSMFCDGLIPGEKKNFTKGIEYFEKASSLEDIYSTALLAQYYYFGKVVPKDYKKAFKYALIAAEGGDVPSQSLVGYLYMKGQGVQKNYDEAYKWLSKAADNGDVVAVHNKEWLARYANLNK